jgi:hypothetical protein
MKKFVSVLCSICLGLFLVDASLSLLDDSLILAFGVHAFSAARSLAFLTFFPVMLLTYAMIGLTPMVPKRWFLPVIFFAPAAILAMLPMVIYHFDQVQVASWFVSLAEVVLAWWILRRVQGRFAFRWPLVPEAQLGEKTFSWGNLLGFGLGNVLVLAPAVLIYLAVCGSLAVGHFTEGFLRLQADGLVACAKTYVRGDGKTILLMPMMHIAEPDFYAQVMKAYPPHAVILNEGVTDNEHLLEAKLDYTPAATALGLSSQNQQCMGMVEGARPADVDVDVFSKPTLDFVNLVARLYANGLDVDALKQLSRKAQNPQLEDQIVADLLLKRNEHLLGEMQAELHRANVIVVPWGATHMPWIAGEIEQAGFRLSSTQEFKIFNFCTVTQALAAKLE